MEKKEDQLLEEISELEKIEDNVEGEPVPKKKKKKKKKKAKKTDETEQTEDKPKEDKVENEDGEGETKPKKKKKKKKKKKANAFDHEMLAEKHRITYNITSDVLTNFVREQDNSRIINLGSWKEGNTTQTSPPSIPIQIQYPKDEDLPKGVEVPHPGKLGFRFKEQQYIAQDEFMKEKIYCLRRSAEVHRQVRKHAQKVVKPGMRMLDIVKEIEQTLRYVCDAEGIERGQAFPTGCSLNHVAAHYTPNYGDESILGKGDVCKIDFGTHFNGYLIDSAFTVAFDPKFQPLLEAVQEATNMGVKTAGVDVTLREIGENIQEVMESHEIELNGKIYPILCVRNLCGHTIERYKVHAGKSIPIVKGGPETKLEEGEILAIETFGSTGKGYIHEDLECSHYMLNFDRPRVPLKHPKAGKLLRTINNNFGTLAWCRRWLDDLGEKSYLIALKELVDKEVVNDYPPLCDVTGSYVAQYEHTILLKSSGKEIMSIGDDY